MIFFGMHIYKTLGGFQILCKHIFRDFWPPLSPLVSSFSTINKHILGIFWPPSPSRCLHNIWKTPYGRPQIYNSLSVVQFNCTWSIPKPLTTTMSTFLLRVLDIWLRKNTTFFPFSWYNYDKDQLDYQKIKKKMANNNANHHNYL